MPAFLPSEVFEHPGVRRLSLAQQLVVVRAWVLPADRWGRVELEDLDDVAYSLRASDADVLAAWDSVTSRGFLRPYCSAGVDYAQIDRWDEWQTGAGLRSRPLPDHPAPPVAVWDAARCTRMCNEVRKHAAARTGDPAWLLEGPPMPSYRELRAPNRYADAGPGDVPGESGDVPGGVRDIPAGRVDVPAAGDVPGGLGTARVPRPVGRDVPGVSGDVPGGSRDVPGRPAGAGDVLRGADCYAPGDVPGASRDVPGVARDVPRPAGTSFGGSGTLHARAEAEARQEEQDKARRGEARRGVGGEPSAPMVSRDSSEARSAQRGRDGRSGDARASGRGRQGGGPGAGAVEDLEAFEVPPATARDLEDLGAVHGTADEWADAQIGAEWLRQVEEQLAEAGWRLQADELADAAVALREAELARGELARYATPETLARVDGRIAWLRDALLEADDGDEDGDERAAPRPDVGDEGAPPARRGVEASGVMFGGSPLMEELRALGHGRFAQVVFTWLGQCGAARRPAVSEAAVWAEIGTPLRRRMEADAQGFAEGMRRMVQARKGLSNQGATLMAFLDEKRKQARQDWAAGCDERRRT